MATFEDVYAKWHKDRDFILSTFSIPVGSKLFIELIRRGVQERDDYDGLVPAQFDKLMIGHYPLTLVAFNNLFERDVPGEQAMAHMGLREALGERMPFQYKVSFLDEPTFRDVSARLPELLGLQGRGLTKDGKDGSLHHYDCKSGELFAHAYLGLAPVPGARFLG